MSSDRADWDPQAAVEAARGALLALISQEAEAEIDDEGRVLVARDSTPIWLELIPQPDTQAVYVTLTCPVAQEVPVTAELFEYVAQVADMWYFGHLCLSLDCGPGNDEGTAHAYFAHALVGADLEALQVLIPLFAMVNTVRSLQGEFIERFGGTVPSAS